MPDSPTEPLRLVSVTDSTIDWAAMGGFDGMNEYASSRNADLLRFLPGASETRWLSVVPLSELAFHKYVALQPAGEARWVHTFLCCIRGVHGWRRMGGPFHTNDWTPGTSTKVKSLDLLIWPEDVLKVVTPAAVQEIGKWCYERAELQQDTVDFFVLPLGCAEITCPRISRAVTQARNSARSAEPSDSGRSGPTSVAIASETNGTNPSPEPSP